MENNNINPAFSSWILAIEDPKRSPQYFMTFTEKLPGPKSKHPDHEEHLPEPQ